MKGQFLLFVSFSIAAASFPTLLSFWALWSPDFHKESRQRTDTKGEPLSSLLDAQAAVKKHHCKNRRGENGFPLASTHTLILKKWNIFFYIFNCWIKDICLRTAEFSDTFPQGRDESWFRLELLDDGTNRSLNWGIHQIKMFFFTKQ